MRICHFTSVHPVYDGRIFYKECTSLAKAGYDVYLIAPDAKNEIKAGVNIVGVSRKKRGRLFRIFFLPRIIYTQALALDADIYHFHDPELLPVGLKLKHKGKKVIFDSHEDVPSDIRHKKYLPTLCRPIFSILYECYEKYVLSKLDAVISVTPHIVERLRKVNKNIYQITNYPICDSESVALPSKEANNDVVFAGGVSALWMHENILKALESTPKDIKYVIAGPTSTNYIEKLKKLNSWNRVDYVGIKTNSEVKEMYENAFAGLAIMNYTANVGGKLGTLGNTKIFEIMGAGVPVICTDFLLWKKIIEKWKCGIYVNPYDIKEIANAICYLYNNPSLAHEMGCNGNNAVKQEYNWNSQEKILLRLYHNLSIK